MILPVLLTPAPSSACSVQVYLGRFSGSMVIASLPLGVGAGVTGGYVTDGGRLGGAVPVVAAIQSRDVIGARGPSCAGFVFGSAVYAYQHTFLADLQQRRSDAVSIHCWSPSCLAGSVRSC